jgi:hypothetical protein
MGSLRLVRLLARRLLHFHIGIPSLRHRAMKLRREAPMEEGERGKDSCA